jgi:hypothetical protein
VGGANGDGFNIQLEIFPLSLSESLPKSRNNHLDGLHGSPFSRIPRHILPLAPQPDVWFHPNVQKKMYVIETLYQRMSSACMETPVESP